MLDEYRAALDRIDDELVRQFCARMDTVKKIGAYKREHHIDALDQKREIEMLDRLTAEVPSEQRDAVRALYRAILSISKTQQRFTNTNIVLIGMPGSGKTSVARHLAALLDRPIASTDETVENRIGMPIEVMFRTQGEAAFRTVETEAVRSLSAVWGSIIATGGGTVLRRRTDRSSAKTAGSITCAARLKRLIRPAVRSHRATARSGGCMNSAARSMNPFPTCSSTAATTFA